MLIIISKSFPKLSFLLISFNSPSISSILYFLSYAFHILYILPCITILATKNSLSPLILLYISSKEVLKSIIPISFEIIGAYVALLSSCFSLQILPFSIIFKVSSKTFFPTIANFSKIVLVVSSLVISTSSFFIISPVSIPCSIYIVVIPVFLSPFKTAHCIGAAPLYLGRSDPMYIYTTISRNFQYFLWKYFTICNYNYYIWI